MATDQRRHEAGINHSAVVLANEGMWVMTVDFSNHFIQQFFNAKTNFNGLTMKTVIENKIEEIVNAENFTGSLMKAEGLRPEGALLLLEENFKKLGINLEFIDYSILKDNLQPGRFTEKK